MSATLFDRLGGSDRLALIVDDIVDNHLKNPKVRTRFENVDQRKLRKLALEFFSAGTGGPHTYSGRDMVATHKGMNISEEEFVAVIDDILLALDQNGVGETEKAEVLSILWSLKNQVIRV